MIRSWQDVRPLTRRIVGIEFQLQNIALRWKSGIMSKVWCVSLHLCLLYRNIESRLRPDCKAYIKRNLPKFTPFIDQLLPAPDSTISSLLTLTQAEILALVSSPGPHESHAEAGGAQARLLAQAKSVLPSYCAKLQKLSVEAAKIGVSDNQSGKVRARAMGSTNQSSLRGDAAAAASLKALSGKDFTANETGPVTKIPFFDSAP